MEQHSNYITNQLDLMVNSSEKIRKYFVSKQFINELYNLCIVTGTNFKILLKQTVNSMGCNYKIKIYWILDSNGNEFMFFLEEQEAKDYCKDKSCTFIEDIIKGE